MEIESHSKVQRRPTSLAEVDGHESERVVNGLRHRRELHDAVEKHQIVLARGLVAAEPEEVRVDGGGGDERCSQVVRRLRPCKKTVRQKGVGRVWMACSSE